MGLFVDLDKVMGEHFERGLDNLKIVCEKQTGYPGQLTVSNAILISSTTSFRSMRRRN